MVETAKDRIPWRQWGKDSFRESERENRLIFLHIGTVWSHWCKVMTETTFADPTVVSLLAEKVIPVWVDGDRLPYVQDRYIAGGWPTNAFLTPTGEMLWSGTYADAETIQQVAERVLAAWQERRVELEAEIKRRRRAFDTARRRSTPPGLVRRETAEDVVIALRASFDARNGGFGDAPKRPDPDAIELFYARAAAGDVQAREIADRTLDGMLAGELWDAPEGGFFRYALEADWTQPRREKLLDANAALLHVYALGGTLRGRSDWVQTAEQIVAWVDRTLKFPDGLWASSQTTDEEYFSATAAERATRTAPPRDTTLYTDRNARWIHALSEAGRLLRRDDWAETAASSLDRLLERMAGPDDLLYHYQAPGDTPALPNLLVDSLACARAAVAVSRATGNANATEHAWRLLQGMQHAFWADDGGFYDHALGADEPAAVLLRDRPFEANAEAVRLLLSLSHARKERGTRVRAERALALLAPAAGRYGAAAAGFALAVEEFYAARRQNT
jgi:uncharacterized protein YyaL (SSP411 family)